MPRPAAAPSCRRPRWVEEGVGVWLSVCASAVCVCVRVYVGKHLYPLSFCSWFIFQAWESKQVVWAGRQTDRQVGWNMGRMDGRTLTSTAQSRGWLVASWARQECDEAGSFRNQRRRRRRRRRRRSTCWTLTSSQTAGQTGCVLINCQGKSELQPAKRKTSHRILRRWSRASVYWVRRGAPHCEDPLWDIDRSHHQWNSPAVEHHLGAPLQQYQNSIYSFLSFLCSLIWTLCVFVHTTTCCVLVIVFIFGRCAGLHGTGKGI